MRPLLNLNMKPTTLYLYAEPSTPILDLGQLEQYITQHIPAVRVVRRPEFIHFHIRKNEGFLLPVAEAMARAKVRNPTLREETLPPLKGEIDYELKRLNTSQRSWGLLYDGFKVMHLFNSLLPPSECNLSHIHIVFTNQLLGTWEESDRRYHARVNILGFPDLISTTGVVEAPAKPRGYYLLKQQYAHLGMDDASAVALESQFRGRFLEHGDYRITEVMGGYVMQSLFYHLLGEAFCEDKNCCLFNAHWQEEVIKAQLGSPYEFCPKHTEQMKQLG